MVLYTDIGVEFSLLSFYLLFSFLSFAAADLGLKGNSQGLGLVWVG